MNGARWLIRELQAYGVPFISVLCGNGLDPLLVAADEAGLRLVDTRNEQAASYVADAYARLTGRLGVCAVSSGVAHVNALAGVLNAYYDGAPVLLITSASASEGLGRGIFQDLDQVALARPICKFAEQVTSARRLPHALQRAMTAATSGRPGPVHLTISVDAFQGDVGQAETIGPMPPRSRPLAAAEEVSSVLSLLVSAQRPLLVAGNGLFYAGGARALHDFARLAQIPVVTPIWDRGVVDVPADWFLGVIGAASGEPALLRQADLVMLVGARVDYRVGYLQPPALAPGARVVRIDADPMELQQGISPTVALLADPGKALEQLTAAWYDQRLAPKADWLSAARAMWASFYGAIDARSARRAMGIDGADIVRTLRDCLPDETTFLVDGGNIGQWAHMLLCRDRYPSHWLTCGASGVVGWGIPGAMAARLVFADRPVVLLSGDGSIGFALVELASAARQGVPFAVVLADDRAWGMVVSNQRRRHERTIASELGNIDYAAAANALGALGITATSLDALQQAVREALGGDGPVLIQVPTVLGAPGDVA